MKGRASSAIGIRGGFWNVPGFSQVAVAVGEQMELKPALKLRRVGPEDDQVAKWAPFG